MSAEQANLGVLFERYGWAYRNQGESIMLSAFQGQSSAEEFIVGARADDQWITLTVPDYLPVVPGEKREQVFFHLLSTGVD